MKTLKALALFTLAAGLAAAQTETYTFNPGVSCSAARVGWDGWQLRSCATPDNPAVSAPNADGSKISFYITQCYQEGWQACDIEVTVIKPVNQVTTLGPSKVTVPIIYLPNGGLMTFQISSAIASGSFTFGIAGCQGGRGVLFCTLNSVGSPSGTLTITQ